MSSAVTPNTPPPRVASPAVRSIITYLLFVHFFFLAVGVKSRTNSSGLEQDLRNKVPGLKAYLQLLAMDLSYMIHLTYYDPTPQSAYPLTDTDFYVEADVPQPDGSTKQFRFPASGDKGLSFQRLERLAHSTGIEALNDNESAAVLGEGIARRLIVEANAVDQVRDKPMRVRVRRRLLPNLMLPPEELRLSGVLDTDRNAPSYFETVYEYDAVLTSDNKVAVVKIGAASNAAGAARRTGTDADSPRVPTPAAAPTGTAAPTTSATGGRS
ncbi:MAG: hypothetical protein JNL96_06575 [Planctomycetaceae bacterium]|nr:hypothetical protein [Planctomycetaceae bacterium]